MNAIDIKACYVARSVDAKIRTLSAFLETLRCPLVNHESKLEILSAARNEVAWLAEALEAASPAPDWANNG